MNVTVDEFLDAVAVRFGLEAKPTDEESVYVRKHYVYGLQGLANLLGCSLSTAARIKKSGVLDKAISQQGKIIATDADLALDIINISNRKSRGRKQR